MEERNKVNSMDIKTYMINLRKNPKFTAEMLQLVESDLQYGLTIAETEEYTNRKFDLAQMKVYSTCLRNSYGTEVKEIIAGDGLTGEQMAVALEFYQKGVSLDVVASVAGKKESTAYAMKRMFQNVVEKTLGTEKISESDMAYAKELIAQMKEVVSKIDYQEKRYDALNEKLKELQTSREDAKIQNNLLAKLTENEKLLEQQQNQINEDKVVTAKLKQELEQTRKENERLVKKSEELEKGLAQQKSIKSEVQIDRALQAAVPENNLEQQGASIHQNISYQNITDQNSIQPLRAVSNTFQMGNKQILYTFSGMEYQTAMVDRNGNIVSYIPVEYRQQKKESHAISAFFSRIFFKKRIDVVRLVAEKNLEPKQLIQIRSAIEKGLDEKQLLVLINSSLPPEQMEEIINIAVFENKQREV